MLHIYIYSFLAGMFGTNGVPHFIKGVLGKKHQTPFGKESSPIVNVIWGWVNFVVAGLILFYANIHPHLLRAFGFLALGSLVMALILSYTWSINNNTNKTKK